MTSRCWIMSPQITWLHLIATTPAGSPPARQAAAVAASDGTRGLSEVRRRHSVCWRINKLTLDRTWWIALYDATILPLTTTHGITVQSICQLPISSVNQGGSRRVRILITRSTVCFIAKQYHTCACCWLTHHSEEVLSLIDDLKF